MANGLYLVALAMIESFSSTYYLCCLFLKGKLCQESNDKNLETIPSSQNWLSLFLINMESDWLHATLLYRNYPNDFVMTYAGICKNKHLNEWNDHLFVLNSITFTLVFIPCGLLCRGCNVTTKQKLKECTLDGWEGNWTLLAVNQLGQHKLTDSAELSHRGEWPAKITQPTCCAFLQISDLVLSIFCSAPSSTI